MQPAGWTILDHTADTGLEVRAPTASSLFETAARGLFSLITDPSTVAAREARRIEVSGGDPGQLMVRWLSEILYLHETEGLLFSRFEVHGLEGGRLRGTAWGEAFDAGRHAIRTALKAITFHQLEVGPDPSPEGGWRARVIVDV